MMKKTMFLVIGIFILSSCKDNENPIGKWDDIIKLSTKSVELTAQADSVTINTQGDWWWVDGISFQDSTYSYYNRTDINLESDAYTITEDDFTVERRDKNTLFVRLKENNTGAERTMLIGLEAGDYFDHVNIQQAGN
ncbi:hypothetical protein [Prolixibacter denitrificans]|uniref:Lipocalin-like protein n=2 Tax=Prolixibacter denitrificans TaxID=1541063 RepID=A0ABQ0ZLS3_9BACT|nr:hypothetical protein [Prolixibacter denitrificans]GET22376.1 hypothetical protein JCM18694_26220 [Prolixibacter denitrificans]